MRNRIRALLTGANRTLAAGRIHLEPPGEFLDILKKDPPARRRSADAQYTVAAEREEQEQAIGRHRHDPNRPRGETG